MDTVASRCETCGRFQREPHDHRPKLEDFCLTPEQAYRDKDKQRGRSLGSATIPDSAAETLEEIREAFKNGDPFVTISKPINASGGTSHHVVAEFSQVKSPVRRRWPWRKRR